MKKYKGKEPRHKKERTKNNEFPECCLIYQACQQQQLRAKICSLRKYKTRLTSSYQTVLDLKEIKKNPNNTMTILKYRTT